MKNIKDNIVYILLGFTFVISIYSSVKVVQIEKDINRIDKYNRVHFENLKSVIGVMSSQGHEHDYSNDTRIDDNESHISDIDNFLDDLEKRIKYTNDFGDFLWEFKKELKDR